MKNKSYILLVTILFILMSPSTVFAKLKFSNTEPYGGNQVVDLNDVDHFTGSETFSGVLEYDDCGKSTGITRSGCPNGYSFTLHDQNEMNKIPFQKNPLGAAFYCGMRSCDHSFILGDAEEYSASENAQLQKLLKSGTNREIKLMVTNVTVGTYPSAHFTLHSSALPKKLPKSGPEMDILLLISMGGGTFFYLQRNIQRRRGMRHRSNR